MINLKIGNSEHNENVWFIMFHKNNDLKMFNFWNTVAEKYHQKMNFGEIDCALFQDIRDRFSVNIFPTFMYYPEDGNMYPFIGYRTIDNITDWIDNQKWIKQNT